MIMIGSDHGGVELKDRVVEFLRSHHHEVQDVGTKGTDSVDYPDYGRIVAREVARGLAQRGILICTNGIGMSILANRFPTVRAALVADVVGARMSREHLDANILIMGGGFIGKFLACEIVKVWLETAFAGGRHQRRLSKITAIEEELGLHAWIARVNGTDGNDATGSQRIIPS